MVLVALDIEEEWKVYNLSQFIKTFNLKERFKEKYKDLLLVNDIYIDDIYKYDLCDQDEIEEFLTELPDKYLIEYINTNHSDYFKIMKIRGLI